MEPNLIYFDQAATTFPKPKSVVEEVARCMESYCGNPGRSGHRMSLRAAEKIYECRTALTEFFGGDAPERTVFTANATYALNLAIKSLLSRGDHVVISNFEHNSVYRPLSALAAEGRISLELFDAYGEEEAVLRALEGKLRQSTRLVAVTHLSNLCGVTLPIAKMGAVCQRHGVFFLVDASQSAGVLPIDVQKCKIDALCGAGHKGLYGPQGTGYLLLSERCAERIGRMRTWVEGGNGFQSLERAMPAVFPERLEVGTLATPAIAGLCAGIRFVSRIGVDAIGTHERILGQRFREMLGNLPGVTLYAPEQTAGGTVLFNLEGCSSDRVAAALDEIGCCVRSGFHCAPLAHERLGTGKNGAVRASFGVFNTVAELESAAALIKKLTA